MCFNIRRIVYWKVAVEVQIQMKGYVLNLQTQTGKALQNIRITSYNFSVTI